MDRYGLKWEQLVHVFTTCLAFWPPANGGVFNVNVLICEVPVGGSVGQESPNSH